MNQFVKSVFASCLGVALAFVVVSGVGLFLLFVIAGSSSDKQVKPENNSVLHLTFGNLIPEQTNNVEMNPFEFSTKEVIGLHDIVESIEHAATDKKIKGIYLNMDSGLNAGIVTASVIRDALIRFKESGKFIVAYSKYYTQGSYYLSSVADKVYVNPMGGIDFHGFASTVPFFKKMLDNIGVKMQVFYAGDFKSATEPFRLEKMSDENRLQLREYLEPVYQGFLAEMGTSRNKSMEELRAIADDLKIRKAEDAVTYGLADATAYVDDVIADLKTRCDLKEKDKLKTISIEEYSNSFKKKGDYSVKDKIALVFAEGAINANQGERGTIVDDKYVKTLRRIREDEKVKAIVFRVNSPGGSALASENIWRELNLAKQAGKKVVVSMGDYAASGGYYISCMADKIVAEPNTLTGSIGVFMMLPNAKKLFNEKIGISFDTVLTAKHSTGLNPFFDLSQAESEYLQSSTIDIYEKFLQRVAEGRNLSRDDVHRIAQGRIWTGTKAKELGLVDELGGVEDAVKLAASLAGIEKYRTVEYPYQKEPLQEFIDELTGQGDDDAIRTKILQKEMGEYYPIYKHIKELLNLEGVQARLPILIQLN
jgi:protease-4